jgi:endonuclease YncB( thermonuclease family)
VVTVEPQAKEVTLQTYGKDKYTRTIGDVILPDGMNLNQELVKQGWCYAFDHPQD